jgi:hypothetical protein
MGRKIHENEPNGDRAQRIQSRPPGAPAWRQASVEGSRCRDYHGPGFLTGDARGQVRSRINMEEDGEVVFRLRDRNGTIRVKLGAGEGGSGFVLLDETTEPAVHMVARRVGTSPGEKKPRASRFAGQAMSNRSSRRNPNRIAIACRTNNHRRRMSCTMASSRGRTRREYGGRLCVRGTRCSS